MKNSFKIADSNQLDLFAENYLQLRQNEVNNSRYKNDSKALEEKGSSIKGLSRQSKDFDSIARLEKDLLEFSSDRLDVKPEDQADNFLSNDYNEDLQPHSEHSSGRKGNIVHEMSEINLNDFRSDNLKDFVNFVHSRTKKSLSKRSQNNTDTLGFNNAGENGNRHFETSNAYDIDELESQRLLSPQNEKATGKRMTAGPGLETSPEFHRKEVDIDNRDKHSNSLPNQYYPLSHANQELMTNKPSKLLEAPNLFPSGKIEGFSSFDEFVRRQLEENKITPMEAKQMLTNHSNNHFLHNYLTKHNQGNTEFPVESRPSWHKQSITLEKDRQLIMNSIDDYYRNQVNKHVTDQQNISPRVSDRFSVNPSVQKRESVLDNANLNFDSMLDKRMSTDRLNHQYNLHLTSSINQKNNLAISTRKMKQADNNEFTLNNHEHKDQVYRTPHVPDLIDYSHKAKEPRESNHIQIQIDESPRPSITSNQPQRQSFMLGFMPIDNTQVNQSCINENESCSFQNESNQRQKTPIDIKVSLKSEKNFLPSANNDSKVKSDYDSKTEKSKYDSKHIDENEIFAQLGNVETKKESINGNGQRFNKIDSNAKVSMTSKRMSDHTTFLKEMEDYLAMSGNNPNTTRLANPTNQTLGAFDEAFAKQKEFGEYRHFSGQKNVPNSINQANYLKLELPVDKAISNHSSRDSSGNRSVSTTPAKGKKKMAKLLDYLNTIGPSKTDSNKQNDQLTLRDKLDSINSKSITNDCKTKVDKQQTVDVTDTIRMPPRNISVNTQANTIPEVQTFRYDFIPDDVLTKGNALDTGVLRQFNQNDPIPTTILSTISANPNEQTSKSISAPKSNSNFKEVSAENLSFESMKLMDHELILKSVKLFIEKYNVDSANVYILIDVKTPGFSVTETTTNSATTARKISSNMLGKTSRYLIIQKQCASAYGWITRRHLRRSRT